MPCRDWDGIDDATCARVETASVKAELATAKQALAEAPKPSLLCEACSLLENTGALVHASQELKDWYKKHEKKEEHKVRLEAAEKLSERERRLLGIDINALRAKAK